MRRLLLALLTALALAPLSSSGAAAADGSIEILQVTGPLDPPVAAAIIDVIEEAEATGSAAVIVEIDSPGGLSVDIDALARRVGASTVPVVAYVGPLIAQAEARGAAAVFAAAAHLTARAPDATIDLNTPRDLGDGRLAVRVDGADPTDLVVDGLDPLIDELDGMTLTTGAGDVTLAIAEDVTVRFHGLGPLRRTLHGVDSPILMYVLLVAVMLLLLFEWTQPGFGVAGIGGLLLTPLLVHALVVLPARWWAVTLIVVGLVALAFDLAINSLRLPTLVGTVAFAVGSTFLFSGSALLDLPVWLVVTMTIGVVVFFVFVMTMILRAQAPPDETLAGELVGRAGVVRSALNPEGHVFVDGALWRARLEVATGAEERLSTGAKVRVREVDGVTLVVEPLAEAPAVTPAG